MGDEAGRGAGLAVSKLSMTRGRRLNFWKLSLDENILAPLEGTPGRATKIRGLKAFFGGSDGEPPPHRSSSSPRDTAIAQRQPTEVIFRSDHRTQHTSLAFGQRCQQAGVRPSMESPGDACDIALCESFFASPECDLLDRYTFKSPTEARLAVIRWIEGWYKSHRRDSALDCSRSTPSGG